MDAIAAERKSNHPILALPVNRHNLSDSMADRLRIGLLVLAADTSCERDFSAIFAGLAPSLFVNRVAGINKNAACCSSVANLDELSEGLTDAANTLVPGYDLDVIAYGCTSGTAVTGLSNVEANIQAARPGVKVTTPLHATIKAFRKLGINSVAAVMPYKRDIAAAVAKSLMNEGVSTKRLSFFGLEDDGEMGRIKPETIMRAVLETNNDEADAIFISCTALRTAALVESIEKATGKLVVTSNQAMAWDCLRLCGDQSPISGFGRLLAA